MRQGALDKRSPVGMAPKRARQAPGGPKNKKDYRIRDCPEIGNLTGKGKAMDIEDVVAAGGTQRVFRAKYKINQPGFISHITQRAAGKEPLFLEKGDYLHFLALLKESASRFELGYYAFCLMPNHVHLLVEPYKPNLDSGMHSLFFRYASFFNRKYVSVQLTPHGRGEQEMVRPAW